MQNEGPSFGSHAGSGFQVVLPEFGVESFRFRVVEGLGFRA